MTANGSLARALGVLVVVSSALALEACSHGAGSSAPGGIVTSAPPITLGPAAAAATTTATLSPPRASVVPVPPDPLLLEPASVQAGTLRDRAGRQLLLRGINLSERSKRPPFTGWCRPRDLDHVVRLGFDHVRLLITWEAVEPRDGWFDDAYLDEISRVLVWCEERGLRAVVDMHQDQLARRFGGDGWPDWALSKDRFPWLPDVLAPFPANYVNPKVVAQFDDFYRDPQRRDRLARAWAHVARRLEGAPALLGWDLLNEPWQGSELVPWKFEAGTLATLERELALAIRAEDPDHVVFFEPHMLAADLPAMGLPSPPCTNAVYAPHFYDPTVDARAALGVGPAYDGDVVRVEAFIANLERQARGLGVPLWVGEWGIERQRGGAREYVRDNGAIFDRRLLSACAWCLDPWEDAVFSPVDRNGNDDAIAADLARPHPRAVAGTLARVGFEPATGRLEVEWDEAAPSIAAPTVVELPEKVYGARALDVSLPTDRAGAFRTERDPRTGRLSVWADPATPRHKLVVVSR